MIESSGISEPLSVAETFTFEDDSGYSLSKFARLDTMVTVVDGYNFLRDYNFSVSNAGGDQGASDKGASDSSTAESLEGRGMAAFEGDERTVVHLLTDQVEFANVILLNKMDLLTAEEVGKLRAVVQHLNPVAKVYETTR